MKKDYENHKKNIQIFQESFFPLWRWTMRINALPNALGNALFPFGAEAQGGVLPLVPASYLIYKYITVAGQRAFFLGIVQ